MQKTIKKWLLRAVMTLAAISMLTFGGYNQLNIQKGNSQHENYQKLVGDYASSYIAYLEHNNEHPSPELQMQVYQYANMQAQKTFFFSTMADEAHFELNSKTLKNIYQKQHKQSLSEILKPLKNHALEDKISIEKLKAKANIYAQALSTTLTHASTVEDAVGRSDKISSEALWAKLDLPETNENISISQADIETYYSQNIKETTPEIHITYIAVNNNEHDATKIERLILEHPNDLRKIAKKVNTKIETTTLNPSHKSHWPEALAQLTSDDINDMTKKTQKQTHQVAKPLVDDQQNKTTIYQVKKVQPGQKPSLQNVEKEIKAVLKTEKLERSKLRTSQAWLNEAKSNPKLIETLTMQRQSAQPGNVLLPRYIANAFNNWPENKIGIKHAMIIENDGQHYLLMRHMSIKNTETSTQNKQQSLQSYDHATLLGLLTERP